MQKPLVWIICCFIHFYSMMSFADEPAITVDNQVINLPSYEGYQFTADPGSPIFKKLAELYATNNSTPLAFYYENQPVNISRVISINHPNDVKPLITSYEWSVIKKKLFDEAKKPVFSSTQYSKSNRFIRAALVQNKNYLVVLWEYRVSMLSPNGNWFEYHHSTLEGKDYINLYGRVLEIKLIVTPLSADVSLSNDKEINWNVMLLDTTSKQLFQLNEPTQSQISLERKAQYENFKSHWKLWLFSIIAIIILAWKAHTTWIPNLIEQQRNRRSRKR